MQSRRLKIQQLMSANNIDGLIASSPENFHYITGFASHQHTVSRQPMFSGAVLTKNPNETPHVFAMDFETPALQEKEAQIILKPYDTWVGVRRWEDVLNNVESKPIESFRTAMEVLKGSIKELDLEDKVIGLEMDFIPLNFFKTLQNLIPHATFVDISPLFIEARCIKTEEEIQHFKTLTRVADEALLYASQFVRVGNTENQVAQAFREHVVKSGICLPSSWSTFNTGSNSSRLCLPTDTAIKDGDVFKFDGGVQGEFNFYTTDTSRGWIVGKGHPKLIELKNNLFEAQRKMIEAAVPGLPIKELFNIGFNHVKTKHPFYQRGHLGHSISMGPQTAEAPYINANESRLLEPGMILAVEVPCYIHGVGGFNIEDMILITDGGAEVLTHRTPHYLD